MELLVDYYLEEGNPDNARVFNIVYLFEYNFCFVEPLVDYLTTEEIHFVYKADRDLRLPNEEPMLEPILIE